MVEVQNTNLMRLEVINLKSVGDASKSVEVEVLAYIPTPQSYLWLEPLNEEDENWYELEPYSEAEADAGSISRQATN